MPRKNFYAILGIEESADPAAIKRAYRRMAFRFHPDAGAQPDPSRFREINEAYEALLDPERRRVDDDNEIIVVRRRPGSGAREPIARPSAAEPLFGRRAAVRVPDDFAAEPDIGEFLDHIAQNFSSLHGKSGGPLRRVGVEVRLTPDEARYGCRVPLELPRYDACPRCGGGGDAGWGLCPRCHGYGMVEGAARIVLEIPPGCAGGERVEINLEDAEIDGLLLAVTILVA